MTPIEKAAEAVVAELLPPIYRNGDVYDVIETVAQLIQDKLEKEVPEKSTDIPDTVPMKTANNENYLVEYLSRFLCVHRGRVEPIPKVIPIQPVPVDLVERCRNAGKKPSYGIGDDALLHDLIEYVLSVDKHDD